MMIDAMKHINTDTTDDHKNDQFERDADLGKVKITKEVDELTIVSTAMVFLIAGYDTTGSTMAMAAYELAMNPEIQDRLMEEIEEEVEKADGADLDYTTLQNMPYLDAVLHETLRMHSPAPLNLRACTKDYKIPGTKISLKAGDDIMIPACGIHMNEKLYPNPTQFNPDNFSKEAKANRSPYTFLAFGQGPRNCLGMRFALLEAKAGIVALLRRFRMVATDKTVKSFKLDPNTFMSTPKERLLIKFQERY